MLKTKIFKTTRGIDENAIFMSPYLGLKLGLCDSVCLSAGEFQMEESYLKEQTAPIYQNLVEGLENTDLAKLLKDLPISMVNHVVSVRNPEEEQIFEQNLDRLLQDLPFHLINNIRLALDVLSGQDKEIATNFYAYIETTTEPMAEFYRYTSIGRTSYYALNLQDAVKDIKKTYQSQCRKIKQTSNQNNFPPQELTNFSILIEKILVNTRTQTSKVDEKHSYTITPTILL